MAQVTAVELDRAIEPDRRRREGREASETILRRAQWLPRVERELIRAVYGDGRKPSQVGVLIGASDRVMRARVRRIVTRMASREFMFVIRRRRSWPEERGRVATALFVEGRPLRAVAREQRVTVHAVRREWDLVRALCAEERAREAA